MQLATPSLSPSPAPSNPGFYICTKLMDTPETQIHQTVIYKDEHSYNHVGPDKKKHLVSTIIHTPNSWFPSWFSRRASGIHVVPCLQVFYETRNACYKQDPYLHLWWFSDLFPHSPGIEKLPEATSKCWPIWFLSSSMLEPPGSQGWQWKDGGSGFPEWLGYHNPGRGMCAPQSSLET